MAKDKNSAKSDEELVVVQGDLRAQYTTQKDGGGFAGVELYDADDYDRFFLCEDELVAFYYWLQDRLRADGLIPGKNNAGVT